MIRALAILLGVVLGLAAAALAAGRVSHLREAGIALPDWTAGFGDASGALAGTWRGDAAGWPVSGVAWDASGAGLGGLVWRLETETPGGSFAADLTVPPRGQPLLSVVDEELDLSRLIVPAAGAAPQGLLVLDRLNARLALGPLRPVSLRGTGRIAGLSFLGADLGTAPVTIEPDGETGWRAEIALDGALTGVLSVAGLYDSPALRIEGTLTEAEPLPSDLRAFLVTVANSGDGTWTVAAGTDARRLLTAP